MTGYEKKDSALREHANFLHELTTSWIHSVIGPLVDGDVEAMPAAFTTASGDLYPAYQQVLFDTSTYASQVHRLLRTLEASIRLAADHYDPVGELGERQAPCGGDVVDLLGGVRPEVLELEPPAAVQVHEGDVGARVHVAGLGRPAPDPQCRRGRLVVRLR